MSLGKKPKVEKSPTVAAPQAAPAAIAETASPEAADTEAKRVRKQMGYQRQVLTGSLTPQTSGKRTVLG